MSKCVSSFGLASSGIRNASSTRRVLPVPGAATVTEIVKSANDLARGVLGSRVYLHSFLRRLAIGSLVGAEFSSGKAWIVVFRHAPSRWIALEMRIVHCVARALHQLAQTVACQNNDVKRL